MLIVRPVQKKDHVFIERFAPETLIGITSLPHDHERLLKKIDHSIKSFAKEVEGPSNEDYFFVLEDLSTSTVYGTCSILAGSENREGYVYKIVEDTQFPLTSDHVKLLRPQTEELNHSELCGLYLEPTLRSHGSGRLLSLSRFLFIAAYPHRFHQRIIANLRGWIDENQNSPFWEAIGRHFCDLSFIDLMKKLDLGRHFIRKIVPHTPIYIDLLPKEVQEVIGKPHQKSKPALKMLQEEGFIFSNQVDLLDGGPFIEADLLSIRAIQQSRRLQVHAISDTPILPHDFLISNDSIDFRACLGGVHFFSDQKVILDSATAKALEITTNDFIRFITLHPKTLS